jgi:hypothetical protein
MTNPHAARDPINNRPIHHDSGERGLAFTLNDTTGVIELRGDPTPHLDRVKNYPLGAEHPGGIYLQPKDKT